MEMMVGSFKGTKFPHSNCLVHGTEKVHAKDPNKGMRRNKNVTAFGGACSVARLLSPAWPRGRRSSVPHRLLCTSLDLKDAELYLG